MTDYVVGNTIHFMFTTRRFSTGAPFALASGVISAYENESLTQITAGITLGADHDGITGLNFVTVVASGANGFEAGKDYHLVVTTGTVDSVSVVGEVVGRFTLERSAAAVDLANATDGLTALKAETAAILADTAELGPSVGASISDDIQAIKDDTTEILIDTGSTLNGRIPAALISGRMDSSVGAMAANVMTAAAAAADLTTELQTGLATAAALTTIDDFLDTEILAIKAQTDLIPSDPADASVIAGLIDALPTAAENADAIWDEAIAGHLAAGSTGLALNSAGAAGDPWATAIPGAYGAGSAGKILGDNINATISSRASQTTLDTLDNFVDTEMAAVLAAVDTEVADIQARLPAALVSGRMDSSVGAMAANVMTAAAAAADLTTELQTGLATAAALTTVDDFLDTEVLAIKAKTDLIPAAPAAVGDIPTANANADALLDRAAGVETGLTVRQHLRLEASVLHGKSSGMETATNIFRDFGDTKPRITATTDADGNRTAVTRDAT